MKTKVIWGIHNFPSLVLFPESHKSNKCHRFVSLVTRILVLSHINPLYVSGPVSSVARIQPILYPKSHNPSNIVHLHPVAHRYFTNESEIQPISLALYPVTRIQPISPVLYPEPHKFKQYHWSCILSHINPAKISGPISWVTWIQPVALVLYTESHESSQYRQLVSLIFILILLSNLRLGLPSVCPCAFPLNPCMQLFSPHECQMPCPSHSPWIDYENFIWRRMQVLKHYVMEFSQSSYSYFITPTIFYKRKQIVSCVTIMLIGFTCQSEIS
jgi:hypothetical protein